MSGEKQRSYSRLYRLWRKIRFLYKRGTLFHSRRIFQKPPVLQHPKQFSIKRIVRRIRFLVKIRYHFRTSTTKIPRPDLDSAKQLKVEKDKLPAIYKAYRKLRFIFSTGRIFRRKVVVKAIPKRWKAIRRMRYLIHRGTFFKGSKKSNQPGRVSTFFKYLIQRNSISIILNSTALNLIAYLFIYLIISFTTSIAALSYNIESRILYYRITFLINKSNGWAYDSIVNVFSLGPILTLFISLSALFLFYKYKERHGLVNLLLLWVFLHGFTRFFGELLVGSIFFKGFGYAARYFFVYSMSLDILYFLILPSFFIMIGVGLFLGDLFIMTGNIYYNHIEKKYYNKFLSSQFIVPFFLGNLFVFLLKLPNFQPNDVFLNLSLGAVLFPAVINARNRDLCLFDDDPRKIHSNYLIILAVILLLGGFRVLFNDGLHIG